MCVIAVCKDRKITRDEFANCFKQNPDGVGFAWGVKFEKGFMKEDLAWAKYNTINTFPHIIHFRRASSGTKEAKFTHPFIVSEESPLHLIGDVNTLRPVMFHNGTYKDWHEACRDYYIKNGLKVPVEGFTDSRFIAILVNRCGVELLPLLRGRFVLYDGTDLKLHGDFIEVKEGNKTVYFSNPTYLKGFRDEYKSLDEVNEYQDDSFYL